MNDPSLSVIIPVYNDPTGIETTLSALTDQDRASTEYEILVVDNGSTDETPSVIALFEDRYPDLVTALSETTAQNSYVARNRGIAAAEGSFIAFVDADMHADPTWVGSVIKGMADNNWRYLGCHVEVYLPKETLVGKFDSLTGFPVKEYITELHFAPTCCLVVDATVFNEVGRFDDRMISGGDYEFGRRVYDAGIDQHYAADVVLYHPVRISLHADLARHVRIGRGIAQQRRFHADRCGSRYPSLYKLVAPPRPRNFGEMIGDAKLTASELAAFYAFEYLEQLARGTGMVYEMGRQFTTPKQASTSPEEPLS